MIGVRPEYLHLRHGHGDTTDTAIRATVAVVESLGHERHVVCRLDDGQLIITREPSDATAPREGDAVSLDAEPDHLHLFDATTGERVDP